jgi:tRNA(Ile)-lysidine synthase
VAKLHELLRRVRECALIERGDRILVGVSGGPDSVALLHALHHLCAEFGLHLEVAHVQHGIRGDDAREDARFVQALADRLKYPFHLREIDLPRMKTDRGRGNLEALARAERYRFFADVVGERKLNKVATAHTLDDQAETTLMWFLRGTGLRGLGGMAQRCEYSSAGQSFLVIRPLLEISKRELIEYLQDQGLSWRIDESNKDQRLLRNWLRLQLLPGLQRHFDIQVPRRLVQQASIFRDEDAFLDQLARDCFGKMTSGNELERSALLEQPRALQRRILRIWLAQARGHLRGIEFIHIEDALRLISQQAPHGTAALPGGWEILREYDRLSLHKSRPGQPPCYDYPLRIGKMLSIPEADFEFDSERVTAPYRLPADLFEAVFDPAALSVQLSVRNFRRGDRFQPFGMQGHKKIKDLFIEKRVPLSLRARWPLLTCGSDVLWIPGHGRSSKAPVTANTAAALRLTARRLQG